MDSIWITKFTQINLLLFFSLSPSLSIFLPPLSPPPSPSLLSVTWPCGRQLAAGRQLDFQQTTDSGCRTLLWLHRALLWLQGFLEKPAVEPL